MPKFTKLSDIEEEDVPWLWRNMIPLGATTILEGVTGTNKSTVLSDWAARVTSGQLMPDGTFCEAPGGVVWVAYEENASYRLGPRLRLQGGDKTKFIDLSRVGRVPFQLPTHMDQLIEAICEVKANLVVIDPLMGMASSGKRVAFYQAAYEVMMELHSAAEYLGVAIVIVNHTSRNQKPGLQSGAASQGFTNFCRSKITLEPSPEDKDYTLLKQVKNNNGPLSPTMVFTACGGHDITYVEGLTEAEEKRSQDKLEISDKARILTFLAAHKSNDYSPETLAKELYPINYNTLKSLLRRMADDGDIAKTGRGKYQHR